MTPSQPSPMESDDFVFVDRPSKEAPEEVTGGDTFSIPASSTTHIAVAASNLGGSEDRADHNYGTPEVAMTASQDGAAPEHLAADQPGILTTLLSSSPSPPPLPVAELTEQSHLGDSLMIVGEPSLSETTHHLSAQYSGPTKATNLPTLPVRMYLGVRSIIADFIEAARSRGYPYDPSYLGTSSTVVYDNITTIDELVVCAMNTSEDKEYLPPTEIPELFELASHFRARKYTFHTEYVEDKWPAQTVSFTPSSNVAGSRAQGTGTSHPGATASDGLQSMLPGTVSMGFSEFESKTSKAWADECTLKDDPTDVHIAVRRRIIQINHNDLVRQAAKCAASAITTIAAARLGSSSDADAPLSVASIRPFDGGYYERLGYTQTEETRLADKTLFASQCLAAMNLTRTGQQQRDDTGRMAIFEAMMERIGLEDSGLEKQAKETAVREPDRYAGLGELLA